RGPPVSPPFPSPPLFRSDDKAATRQPAALPQLFDCRMLEGKDGSGVRIERGTGFGQLQPFAAAPPSSLDKHDIELALQLGNAFRHGGLAQMQPPGGSGKTAFRRDGVKDTQEMEIEAQAMNNGYGL